MKEADLSFRHWCLIFIVWSFQWILPIKNFYKEEPQVMTLVVIRRNYCCICHCIKSGLVSMNNPTKMIAWMKEEVLIEKWWWKVMKIHIFCRFELERLGHKKKLNVYLYSIQKLLLTWNIKFHYHNLGFYNSKVINDKEIVIPWIPAKTLNSIIHNTGKMLWKEMLHFIWSIKVKKCCFTLHYYLQWLLINFIMIVIFLNIFYKAFLNFHPYNFVLHCTSTQLSCPYEYFSLLLMKYFTWF